MWWTKRAIKASKQKVTSSAVPTLKPVFSKNCRFLQFPHHRSSIINRGPHTACVYKIQIVYTGTVLYKNNTFAAAVSWHRSTDNNTATISLYAQSYQLLEQKMLPFWGSSHSHRHPEVSACCRQVIVTPSEAVYPDAAPTRESLDWFKRFVGEVKLAVMSGLDTEGLRKRGQRKNCMWQCLYSSA